MFNSVKTQTSLVSHSQASHSCKGNEQEKEFSNVNMYYDENNNWDTCFSFEMMPCKATLINKSFADIRIQKDKSWSAFLENLHSITCKPGENSHHFTPCWSEELEDVFSTVKLTLNYN